MTYEACHLTNSNQQVFTWKKEYVKRRPIGELVICKDFTETVSPSGKPKMKLAYKFAIYATDPLRYTPIGNTLCLAGWQL